MAHSEALVILVSRFTERESDFFSIWEADEPSDSPYAVYLNGAGSPCLQTNAELILIQGHRNDLATRALFVARSLVGFPSAFFLVHTGAGETLTKTFANEKVQPDDAAAWTTLAQRSFTLVTGHGPYTFIKNELADYAANKRMSFPDALRLLRSALNTAVESHPGGLEYAEKRSSVAAEYLENTSNRVAAGLSVTTPPRPRQNPVAALIHDVVSRFDALLIDLQTGLEDKDYWTEVKVSYTNRFKCHLDRLDNLLTEQGSNTPTLDTVSQIADKIIESKTISSDEQVEIQRVTASLSEFAPKRKQSHAVTLLTLIDEGNYKEVITADVKELRLWSGALRQNLSILDDLFKKSRPKK